MTDLYIEGHRILLDASRAIGKGGEADIFEIPPDNPVEYRAVKVFKAPDHPDLTGLPHEQEAARRRLELHQTKLRHFPTGLPDTVMQPLALATDRAGQRVLGYKMAFLRGWEVLAMLSQRSFRDAGVPNEDVVRLFQQVHPIIAAVHRAGVVIGDCNDLNWLWRANPAKVEVALVDADSMQWPGFPCVVFTARFVDPLLCDPQASSPNLTQPHNPQSDWYAFRVMLFQSLLFVDPFGGLYRPKDPARRMPHAARSLHGISVLHSEVGYPKPATPFKVLPDAMLDDFQRAFERRERTEYPMKLLHDLRWAKCTTCGLVHARTRCPDCQVSAPQAVQQQITVRGEVTATRLFQTPGVIVHATLQDGKLHWLTLDQWVVRREDGSLVVRDLRTPNLRYRIRGTTTFVASTDALLAFDGPGAPRVLPVARFGNLPMFDTNSRSLFQISHGALLREVRPEQPWDAPLARFDPVGQVLDNQTLFWVGETFGFGFYRAGNLSVAFVFDAEQPGLNDSVRLPPWHGQLLDSSCAFSSTHCWFFLVTQEGTRRVHRCTVLNRNGQVLASAEAEAGNGSWLGGLVRGGAAAGDFLLASTDEGVVKISLLGNDLQVTRNYPDTEPFVSSATHLFAAPDGLYAVGRQNVVKLVIKAARP